MHGQENRILEDLEVFEAPRGTQAVQSGAPKQAIKKISYTHEAMIDLIIAHPAISNDQLAAHFGYTPSWISTMRATETFKHAYAERRKQLVDPVVMDEVKTQFEGIVGRSIELLKQKLDKPAAEVSDNLCLRAMEIGAKALGYGASQTTATVVQVNVEAHLENMAGNLTKLLQRKVQESALPDPAKDFEGDEDD